MSIPKEPRQQMINIMYLVLIALLALSVSAEILNAFKVVNRGITNSNEAINDQIVATLAAFEDKVAKNEDPEAAAYLATAQSASDVTGELTAYIDEIEEILKEESGVDPITGELNENEDQDTPSRVMIGNNKDGKGYELEEKINAFRDKYVDLFKKFKKPGIKSDIEYISRAMPLNAEVPENQDGIVEKDWPNYNFYQMPMAGALTLLNQIRNDAIATEAMVVQRFSEKVGGVNRKITFDKMKVVTIPSSKSVFEGDPFELEVFLASTTNDEEPNIIVNGQKVGVQANGKGVYRASTNGQLGKKRVTGTMAIADGSGGVKSIPFSTEYTIKPRPKKPSNAPEIEAARLAKELDSKKVLLSRTERELNELKRLQKQEIDPKEVERLRKKVVDLEQRIPKDDPRKELLALQRQFKQLQTEKSQLQTEKNQLQQQIPQKDNSKQELAQVRQQLKDLEKRNNELLKKVPKNDPRKELEQVRQRLAQVEREKTQLAAKVPKNNPQNQINDLQNQLKKLEERNKQLASKVPKNDPRAEIDKIRRELDQVKKQNRDLASKVPKNNPQRQITDLQNKLKELERRNKDLASKVPKNNPKAELDKIRRELDQVKRENQQLKRPDPQLAKLVDENKRLKASQKNVAQIQGLENKIKQLEQEKRNKPKAPNNKAEIQKLQREIERLKKERKPVGVVSADKMNVFYIGVDNPITVSVSGVSQQQVKASLNTGSLRPAGGAGQYVAQVPPPAGKRTSVNLTVGGQVIDRKEFRIKRVPDPVPEVGGKAGGVLGTGEMKAQRGLIARLKDFDFDARFEVLGFEMTLAEKGQDLLIVTNKGPRFNDKSKTLLGKAKVGSIYYFDNIKVKGPDKATRKLPSISFKIR